MISIEKISKTLDSRVVNITRYVDEARSRQRFERYLFQSAAVSFLWQAWVLHNRSLLDACLSGQLSVNGRTLRSPIHHLSEGERMHHAQQYSEKNTPKPGKVIKSHLSEPNWGDLDKVLNICLAANFERSDYILACFGLASRIKDLQLCRNTCSHMTKGQVADFGRSRVRYRDNRFLHPSDMMNWIDPDTDRQLWNSWCGEMTTITELLAST